VVISVAKAKLARIIFIAHLLVVRTASAPSMTGDWGLRSNSSNSLFVYFQSIETINQAGP
jgi:hypothetical protein